MQTNLEKFEANKLQKNELFPVMGGLVAAATNTNGNVTRSTGNDCDSGTGDADDDPTPPAATV